MEYGRFFLSFCIKHTCASPRMQLSISDVCRDAHLHMASDIKLYYSSFIFYLIKIMTIPICISINCLFLVAWKFKKKEKKLI